MIINKKEYVTGVFRGDNGDKKVTHLYQGTFNEPGYPMCSRGWQIKQYDKNGNVKYYGYSIFRNNVSKTGICSVCLKRAKNELKPINNPSNKKTTKI